jgi:hypothetical protein
VAARCPRDRVILSLLPPGGSGQPTFVEAARDRTDALAYRRGVGLLPIGEFSDFRMAPQPVRDAFAAALACVERDPPPFDEAGSGDGPPRAGTSKAPWWMVPWRLLAGLVLTAPLLGRPQRKHRCRSLWRTLAPLLALAAATFGVAYAVAPWTFFHQNGHGAIWIGYALGDPSAYGPGFGELYGWLTRLHADASSPCWVARRWADPERTVFLLNGALVSLVPPCVWVICRRAGAARSVAWAAAAALAIDPLVLRVAFTESYYAPYLALSFLGTAIALSARTLSPCSARFALANTAAALVLAQAARIHPVGWIALAVVPLAHLGRRGATRRLVRHAAMATLVVGAVIVATSASSLVGVLRGGMGTQYLPEWWRSCGAETPAAAATAIGGVLVGGLLPRGRPQVRLRVATAGVVVAAAALGATLLRLDVDWVRGAHARLFAPPCIAIATGIVLPWTRARHGLAARLAPAALLLVALLSSLVHARWITELPTDALELRLALGWRARIPCGARVAALERAGIMELQLPVYPPEGTDERDRWLRLDAAQAVPSLGLLGRKETYYYRSSLCSTAPGRGWCDALERTAVLEPIEQHELPARLSANGGGYDAPTVRVGLYRVATPR